MEITEINAHAFAEQLTEHSIQRDLIARHAYNELLAVELLSMCDDSATDDHLPEAEYWGSDDAGNEWRVHLVRA